VARKPWPSRRPLSFLSLTPGEFDLDNITTATTRVNVVESMIIEYRFDYAPDSLNFYADG
jgi:hypothetical protein